QKLEQHAGNLQSDLQQEKAELDGSNATLSKMKSTAESRNSDMGNLQELQNSNSQIGGGQGASPSLAGGGGGSGLGGGGGPDSGLASGGSSSGGGGSGFGSAAAGLGAAPQAPVATDS